MTRYSVFALGMLAALTPQELHGLGLRLPDQDAFAVARGDAFVATADNPAAVYYNPAGITQLKGQNFRGGFYAIGFKSSYTGPTGNTVDTRNRFQAIPQFYYTFSPDSLPLSFGLGFYSPYGMGLEWPENGPFRTLAIEGQITYLTLNPVVAWQIMPSLSLAIGPTFNYAEASLRRGIAVPGDEFKFKGDDTDAGFNAGLLWKPHRQHAFGLSYRSETTLNFNGHLNVRNPLFPRIPIPSGSFEASARYPFPQHLVLGWSYRPTPAWNFEFDADWTDWNRLDTVNLESPLGNIPQIYKWRSSLLYEWGATRFFTNGYSLSAGYMFSENSIPDANFNPSVPDSDRHIFSFGFGHEGKRWQWQAAYQLGYGPARTVSNSPLSLTGALSADGRYEFISQALIFSYGHNF